MICYLIVIALVAPGPVRSSTLGPITDAMDISTTPRISTTGTSPISTITGVSVCLSECRLFSGALESCTYYSSLAPLCACPTFLRGEPSCLSCINPIYPTVASLYSEAVVICQAIPCSWDATLRVTTFEAGELRLG